jgi:hypothetical protein
MASQQNFTNFLEVVKPDLLVLFHEFHEGRLPLHSLNFEVILLPEKRKQPKFSNIGQYTFLMLVSWFHKSN